MDTEKDLEKLLPLDVEVKAGGETIVPKPFPFGHLPKAVKLLRPIVDAAGSANIMRIEGDTFMLAPDWPLRLPALMDEAGESLLGFVAFAIGKPRDWLDTIGADEGVALTKAVFEVNGDFFAKRIAPLLGMAIPVAQPGGAPSSPD
jgi:hypothetical protein